MPRLCGGPDSQLTPRGTILTVRGLIIDIGGVLVQDHVLETMERWADQLVLTREELLAAIYGGNDDAVLIGRVTEDEWWEVVHKRLGMDTSDLRGELESGQTWSDELVAVLRSAKAATRTAILSNAWPSQRARMVERGLGDLVDELLLSCEIGCAKPDVNAFIIALERLGTAPAETLVVDDTPGHVAVAEKLGISGHVHSTIEDTIKAVRRFAAGS